MSGEPDLVLFTARFPYNGSESVLGDELEVLSRRFNRVYIIPSLPGTDPVPLPPNVTCVDLGWQAGWSRKDKLQALCAPWIFEILQVTGQRRDNWRPYASGSQSFLDILASSALKARTLATWISENQLRNAVFYDYWFENATLALAILRRTQRIRCAIARAHGFDVFDWRWEELGRVPFREFKAKHLDAIFPVSKNGADYMAARLGRDAAKLTIARLGIRPPRTLGPLPTDIPRLVSCAALRPGKQIARIPAILEALGHPVSWIHFGDGPERPLVEHALRSLPPQVDAHLAGWRENAEVRRFYSECPVSALISVSRYEGIPISMMEAQSFGIPVVSLDVGGINELVSEATGVLLDREASNAEIAAAISDATRPERFNRTIIKNNLASSYDSQYNYERFADRLISIWTMSSHDGEPRS